MRRFAWTMTIGLALPAAAIAVGGGTWPFELAYHFVAHLMFAAAMVSAACLLLRQRAPALALGTLAAIYGALAFGPPAGWTAAWARDRAPGTGNGTAEEAAALTLVSFNLLADHKSPGQILAWLATGPADVLVLVEASPLWRAQFEGLRAVYPYRAIVAPQPLPHGAGNPKFSTNTGVAILSRLPLHRPRALFPAGPDRPAVAVEVETAAGPLTLAAVHPTKPLSPAGLELRDRYLMDLASALADWRGPLILAGDFNATHHAPIIRRLRSNLGLSLGPQAPATYPAGFGPLGLAIDHVLVRGARFQRLEPLAARGSDHRGLYALLSLPLAHGRAQ